MNVDLRKKLFLSLFATLILYAVFALWSDWQKLTDAISGFPWVLMIPVIGLTLFNFTLRIFRWHWWLELVGVTISRYDSARIFGVGMLMIMTPGKAGEIVKCYMVKNVSGTGMTVTAPVILAERVIDGLAMLILAGLGLIAFPDPAARTVAILLLTFFVAVIVVVQNRPLAMRALEVAEHLPIVKKLAGRLHILYESSYLLFRPANLLLALVVGILVWGAEGFAYAIVLSGFGVPFTGETILQAIFIFNISTVIGAVVATPGGVGGFEGSAILWSQRLFGLSQATATAGALLIRFATLWLTVLVGAISFTLWSHLLDGSEAAAAGAVSARQPEGDSPA